MKSAIIDAPPHRTSMERHPTAIRQTGPVDATAHLMTEAAEAGRQVTLEAIETLILAANGRPDQLSLDMVDLAKSRIDQALAMMQRVEAVASTTPAPGVSNQYH